jgi:hypothetical protein
LEAAGFGAERAGATNAKFQAAGELAAWSASIEANSIGANERLRFSTD